MPAEQQLIDYIKKARDAKQSDDQSRSLLYKNGWTEAEVADALAELSQPSPKPAPQIQPQVQSQQQEQPIANQPQPPKEVIAQVQPEVKSTPVTQPQQQNSMPQMKVRSHFFMKFLIVLIMIVLLVGGALFAAGQYLNFPWNPFRVNSQTVINNMLTNMKNVKSSHTTIQADIVAISSDTKKSQGELKISTNSESDVNDINNPKADGNFTINLTMPGSTLAIASASVNMAIIGGAAYFKINSIITPNTFSYPGLNISQINGKWLKIDQDSVKALSQVTGQTVIPDVSQTNNSELAKKIRDLIAVENMLSVSKQLGDQVVGGQDTYHYLVTISKVKLEDLIAKIVTLEIQQAPVNSQTPNNTANNSGSLVENMAQAAAKTFVDAIGDVNIELWIGKKDYMLYELKIDKVIDLSKIYQAFNMQIGVKFDLANSNFNKQISVQEPTGAQKIEDILLPVLKIQKTKSDMSLIGFAAESIFSTDKSYYLLCKNGFLNGSKKTPGTTLTQSVNDILKQGAKNPVCFGGLQDYCVSTQLADGSYLCISKSTGLGTTICTYYKTGCK